MADVVQLTFLGTGASGGTPGEGRSRRRESSLLIVAGDTTVLVDATRDLEDQVPAHGIDPDAVDVLVLTHAHRDASGGVPALRRLRGADAPPVPTYAAPASFSVLDDRYVRLDHLDEVPVRPGGSHRLGPLRVTAVEVPHARDGRFPTYAWRFTARSTDGDTTTVLYSSDVAAPTDELARFSAGADLLVVDGAMYGRSIFSHLRVDRDLPVICGWEVDRILLTQIGRTAPAHTRFADIVAQLCDRAAPAFDGLQIEVGA